MMKDEIELSFDYPANIAKALKDNTIDIGLVPVAAISALSEHYIVSDYCISCDGEVSSVCLFSDVPLQEIESILLDYQSRTSVALLKILLKDHWKINPELITGTEGYESKIAGKTAGLIIGDRALEQKGSKKHIYDLGLAWKEMTGFPFVFAAWVSNKKMTEDFLIKFNQANKLGLLHMDDVLAKQAHSNFDLKKYFTHYIKYDFTEDKRKALSSFLGKLRDV